MLLKGYRKNLIVIKGIGSDYIEEAYLILRPELPSGAGQADIVKEANRIIHEYDSGKKKKRRRFSFPSFFIGVLLTGAVGLFLFLFL